MTKEGSPEQEGPGHYPRRERRTDLPAFHEAVRFSGEQAAGQAYEQAQEAIYSGPPNDLSVYRLIVNTLWHVALLGLAPPPQLYETLSAILGEGEPAELPPELWQALNQRRRESIRRGPWTERHYRL